jgi:surface antigen
VVDYRAGLQCVPFAREASGIQIYGDANTWWARAAGRYPRSSHPAVGSVFVLEGYNNPGRGHVSVVTEVESERVIRVDHANWLNNGEISVSVPIIDVSPNNDWSEVRVWHIPGGHWGGRIYRAQGFIHPFTLQAALS